MLQKQHLKLPKEKKWFDELFGEKMAKSTFSRVKKNEAMQ